MLTRLKSENWFHASRSSFPPLAELLTGEIQRGVSPDIVAAHVLKGGAAAERRIEEEVSRQSVSGSQIRRYRHWQPDQTILYTDADTPIDDFPRALDYLREYRSQNTCKEVATRKHPWWRLHRPRDEAIFQSPKFIGLTTTKRIEVVFDRDQSIYVTDAMYVFSTKAEVEPLALMAILHSRAFDFLYRVANQGESRVIPQVKATKLVSLPVPWSPDLVTRWSDLAMLVERMLAAKRHLQSARSPADKIRTSRMVDSVDRQIDELVYALYGLSDAEVDVVETVATVVKESTSVEPPD